MAITNEREQKICDKYSAYDEDIKNMDVCFNCKYWIGGGDWGLSCEKNYYNCDTNGFRKVCEQFERKE